MKKRVKIAIWLIMFLGSYSQYYGQMETYDYKRELNGISDQWHSIILPNDLFGKASHNLADVRLFGISANQDTLEAPYIIRVKTENSTSKDIVFKTLNTSYNNKGSFFTFEIPTKESINQIKLDFEQENFDWRLTLEGSQNQREWFTITENYRITSIKNELTDFQFTTVRFPNSSYRFFRIRIDSKEKPDLTVAHLTQSEKTEGVFRNYPIKIQEFGENKKEKQTEIKLELQVPVAVSHLKINISDKVDYYRPITIMYLSDSVKTEKGWKYSYSKLTSGTLNSMEENEFKFKCTTLKNLKIIIYNQDNQALSIDSIQVKGYIHEIVARFTEPANYFLTYGNEKAVKASYDIERFTDKIPDTLKALDLGIEQKIGKEKEAAGDPLFENENWLWLVMTVIIGLLGWFSLKMMRK